MRLTPWMPYRDLDQMFDMELFPRFPVNYAPAVDVYQTDNDVVVETPLAGVDPEQVNIAIEGDMLTIRGHLEERKEVKEKEYYRREVRTGEFVRSVDLPVPVQSDKAVAASKNGMLKITVPKAEHAKPKTIKVAVEKE